MWNCGWGMSEGSGADRDSPVMPVPPGTSPSDYETVAGFIIDRMGRLPSVADSVEVGELRFEGRGHGWQAD